MPEKVLICLPSYKTMEPRMAFSVMALLNRNPGRCALAMDYGDAFIVHSRNKLADHFLSTNFDWQLTIDDDMVLPFGEAGLYNSFTGFNLPNKFSGVDTLGRLLGASKTLVGALYRGRWPDSNWIYAEGGDPQEKEFIRRGPHDLVKPTRWVGTGCLLVHRTVYQDIEKKFPHLARNPETKKGGQWFTSSEHDLRIAAEWAVNDPDNAASIIDQALTIIKRNSPLGQGEDVTLCVRATQSGHIPHVDFGCIAGHVGSFCYGKPS